MRLYLGFEFKAIDGWEKIHPPITAPSNYKKEEAIQGYIQKELDKLANGGAAEKTITGEIANAVVVQRGKASVKADPDRGITEEKHFFREGDPNSGEIANDGDPQVIYEGPTGAGLIRFLLERTGLLTDSDRIRETVLIGHQIKTALRIAALSWIKGGTGVDGQPLPFSLHGLVSLSSAGDRFHYNSVPGFIDPVSVLFGSSDTAPPSVALRMGLEIPTPAALDMALFSFALSQKAFGI